MKKFWEKHDLVKVSGILVLISVLLTWVIPQGYFDGSAMQVGDITRVGIFDFFTYGLLGMYYFTVLVTFLFVMGGFYQVLARSAGYQKITDKIAKIFKGKEILFVLIITFILSGLTAVGTEYFVMIAFIPFFASIMKKMGLDKMTGFIATFGALLVGIIGSVYNAKVAGINVTGLGLEYNTYLWLKLVLFAVSYILFSLFAILHIRKIRKNKKADLIEENYESETSNKKSKAWPIAIILGLTALVGIIAYLPWETWNVKIFSDATTAILECKVFDSQIFKYILGEIKAFGSWDIFGMQVLMLISALLVKLTSGIKNNEFIDSFGEGLRKNGKLVIVLLLCYFVLEIVVMYPVLPTIVSWIMSLSDKFNVLLGIISGLFTSLFTVEYQYTISLIGNYLTTTYVDFAKEIPVLLQSTFGLASFISPASAILLIGLSYFGITFKDWMKYIWKFALGMLAVIVVLMIIIF